MKKKAKATTGPKCTSSISAGAFKCQLTGEHETHSSAVPGRKGGQHARWSAIEDGRIHVVTFSSGKEMSEWHEEPPAVPHKPLTLDDEPQDDESDDPLEDEVRSDADRDLAREMREAREAHARELEAEPKKSSLADACPKCGKELGEHDGKKCPKVEKSGRWLNDWTWQDARGIRYVGSTIPKHALKSKPASVKIEQQAEVVTTEPSKPGDTRTNERGHNERWCWGPVGAWGWRSYPAAKGRGCIGCGRHKADCLCKQMPNVEPEPATVAPSKLTKIGSYEVHPAAALFPMIGEAKWPAFVDDIRTNGQRTKIVRIQQGDSWVILDGRNRLKACIELKIEPKFRAFGDDPTDGGDPIAFVTSLNIQRRQLDETELAYVGLELVPMYEAQAKERQRMSQGRGQKGSATLRDLNAEKASEAAAKAVGVSPRTIESAMKVQRDAAPEVLAASKDRGQMAVSAAAELAKLPKPKQREIMEREGGKKITLGKAKSLVRQEEKRSVVREINADKVAPAPLGPFGLIVIDPPWPYDNSDQHEGSRGHIDYPSMSIQALCDLDQQLDARAKEDCILGLWVTNAFIHEVGRLLFSWGFEHRTMITWDKERAGVGTLPRGQTEHLVIATRGAPVHTLNEVTTMLRVPRREHSRKPDEMYELLAKHCSGPMIDMFSREERPGFATWGAELNKFATEAA